MHIIICTSTYFLGANVFKTMTVNVQKILCLVYFIGLLHTQLTNGSKSCICTFKQTISTANCKNHTLNEVPDCVPTDVEHLLLSYNHFRILKSKLFIKVRALKTLDLAACHILSIEDGAFEGLSNLTELNLARNDLIYKNSISKNAFTPLIALKRIWLQGNCNSVWRRTCFYHDHALSKLHGLTDIYLDGHNNEVFGKGFSHLKNIQNIRLENGGHHRGYCFLPYVKTDMFDVFKHTHVKKIELIRCYIKQIEPNVFRNLKNLTELSVVSNRDLCERGFYNLSVGLDSTNISVLTIRDWCQTAPFDLKIDKDVSGLLLHTNLHHLEVSQVGLTEIPSHFITRLPKTLTRISFSKNRINDLRILNFLNTFTKLQKIDLSCQQKYPAPTKNRYGTTLISTRANEESFSKAIDLSPPSHLEVLNISRIYFDLPFNIFHFQQNSIKIIDSSNCMIGFTSGEIIGLDNLERFDLSNNHMEFIHENTFRSMMKLEFLSLYNNNIGLYISENGKAFERLGTLKILFINKNGISKIPNNFFKSMTGLHYLNLAENHLTVIDFSLMSLGNLEYLDLSSNNIATISPANLQFLKDLSSLSLDLHKNNLSCTCKDKLFLSWLAVTSVYVLDKEHLFCRYQNQSPISLSKSSQIIDQLKYDCSVDDILLFICIVLSMSVFILSVLGVIYRKRWQIKYLYYIGKKSINPYHPLEGANVELDVDVYISYDMDEMLTPTTRMHKFVVEVVNPFLTRNNCVVKIREDIPPGRKVSFELASILRSSKKLVVFLSRDYWNDYWNLFEFNMSVLEGIYTKRDVVILVIVGNLGTECINLPTEMKSVVNAKIQAKDVITIGTEFDTDDFLEQLLKHIKS